MVRSTLLISTYNSDLRPWNGVTYEFMNVIRSIENSTTVAPGEIRPTVLLNGSLFSGVLRSYSVVSNILLQVALLRHGSRMQTASVTGDHDLCLFMCQFPRDLANIERVKGWRERSRFAAAFLLESWPTDLERQRAHLKILDRFDHVFVLNAAAIPQLRRYTKTPISFLPTAADSLAAAPQAPDPERVIDLLCLGRRLPAVHEKLLDVARRRRLFYLHDLWGNIRALNWDQVRAANADMIRRSRYFIVFAPGRFDTRKSRLLGASPLSTRYFEGAAGGAIMLGCRPTCEEFDTLFDWPDAVIEVAPDGHDVEARLVELDADPERCDAIRKLNVINSLRRHDWAHRWDEVLQTFGMERSPAHEARLRELDERAREVERNAPAASGPARRRLVDARPDMATSGRHD